MASATPSSRAASSARAPSENAPAIPSSERATSRGSPTRRAQARLSSCTVRSAVVAALLGQVTELSQGDDHRHPHRPVVESLGDRFADERQRVVESALGLLRIASPEREVRGTHGAVPAQERRLSRRDSLALLEQARRALHVAGAQPRQAEVIEERHRLLRADRGRRPRARARTHASPLVLADRGQRLSENLARIHDAPEVAARRERLERTFGTAPRLDDVTRRERATPR